MRVFIAALIPQEVKIEIKKYLDEIKPNWEGVKWEDYEKLHVTLKFIGKLEESKIEEVEAVLRESVKVYSPLVMEISRFGGFPSLSTPRVLFIGLSENHELSRLHAHVEYRLERLGFSKESRSFVPHVTVGRVRGKARLKGILPIPSSLSFFISEIAVMKSVLHREGSKYTPLSVFRLCA